MTTQSDHVSENRERDIFSPEWVAAHKAQAAALKGDAAEFGLQFQAYFAPNMAKWVLEEIEHGGFLDPSEAVMVAIDIFKQLSQYPDLREELSRREIQESFDDRGSGIPVEEVFAKLEEKIDEFNRAKMPTWKKIPYPGD